MYTCISSLYHAMQAINQWQEETKLRDAERGAEFDRDDASAHVGVETASGV